MRLQYSSHEYSCFSCHLLARALRNFAASAKKIQTKPVWGLCLRGCNSNYTDICVYIDTCIIYIYIYIYIIQERRIAWTKQMEHEMELVIAGMLCSKRF